MNFKTEEVAQMRWLCILLGVLWGQVTSAQEPKDLWDLLDRSIQSERTVLPEEISFGAPGLKEERERPELVERGPRVERVVALDRPVDPNSYVVGPGDGFVVYIWGQVNQYHDLTVTPEGKLIVPYVEPIKVAGLTLAEAKRRVIQKVQERYRAKVSVELKSLRRIRVFVTGYVAQPGAYDVTPVHRAMDVLMGVEVTPMYEVKAKAGLMVAGSRRNIKIFRRNGDTLRVDLDRFINLGDLSANPYLEAGDIIYVPPRSDVVHIYGAVKIENRSAYELLPGETVADLVELAGGLREDAWHIAELVRFKDDGVTKERYIIDLNGQLHNPDDPFYLKPGDQLFIRHIPNWRPRAWVEVIGEVKHPGPYPIKDGVTTLSQVIEEAGGFTKDAALERATLERRQAKFVLPDPEFQRLRQISSVMGGLEKMKPLEYDYLKTRSRENRYLVSVDFEKLFLEGDKSQDVVLRYGDVINIPRKWETVTVSGQVEHPGMVPFVKGMGPEYYIRQAGGYTKKADKGRVQVIKARTQVWMSKDEAKTLEPGDTIFVPEHPEHDWWGFVKDASAVAGQLATFIILARSIANM